MSLPRLYKVREVADAARQTPKAIYNAIEKGSLPARQVGGSIRIAEEDALRYLGSSISLSEQSDK